MIRRISALERGHVVHIHQMELIPAAVFRLRQEGGRQFHLG